MRRAAATMAGLDTPSGGQFVETLGMLGLDKEIQAVAGS